LKLFCFLGPSGGGKSTIQHSLPNHIKFLTHYVTRPVREGEIDGYHVKHVHRDEFEELYRQGWIVTRTEYAGNLYGAPLPSIREIIHDKIPYHATATIESIQQFKELLGKENVVTIYIKPPSIEALRERMKTRGDSEEAIEKRILHIYSAAELENEKLADYVVVNDDLIVAKAVVLGIIHHELYGKKKAEVAENENSTCIRHTWEPSSTSKSVGAYADGSN
jgi:guanylate kinase